MNEEALLEGWPEEISLPTIRQVLEENGLLDAGRVDGERSRGEQGELFEFEADRQLDLNLGARENGEVLFSEGDPLAEEQSPAPGSSGSDAACPEKRRSYSSGQRVYFDRLEQGDYNAYAGGLLFAPLLERYEFLPTLKRVIELPTHEGYSLEELCLTLLYADIFGFRSMEDLKRAYPEEYGVLIGRTQSPSVFTLRRFLHKGRKLKKSESLIDEFAVSYLRHGLAQWGVMYIDGHFLPYHGMYRISMGWHGVRQMAMKGSYNFLAVDEGFRP